MRPQRSGEPVWLFDELPVRRAAFPVQADSLLQFGVLSRARARYTTSSALSRAFCSARRLLPERTPPRISSFTRPIRVTRAGLAVADESRPRRPHDRSPVRALSRNPRAADQLSPSSAIARHKPQGVRRDHADTHL